MAAPKFIRIGAPSGDGPAAPVPTSQPAPPAAPPAGSVLPPEVFGVWSEEAAPAPAVAPAVPVAARPEGSPNGHGGVAPGMRQRPAAGPRPGVRAMPVSARPAAGQRGGRISHEDERLNAMRKSGMPVEVVCFDDVRLKGRLVAFDQYALILEDGGQETLLFKHGVIMVRYAE